MSRLVAWACTALALLAAGCGAGKPTAPPRHVPAIAAKEALTAGIDALRVGDLDAAQEQVALAIATDPAFGGAHLYEGFILSRRGEDAAATEAFRRAVELDPYNCESPLFLGLMLEQRGDMEAARSHYLRSAECFADAVQAQGTKPQLRVYEAVARYLHRGKLEGLQAISAVLTDYPEFPPAVRVRARFVEDDRKYFYRWASAPDL